jgi:hypothetical protein
VLQFGTDKRDSLSPTSPYPWEALRVFFEKDLFEKRKILRKDWGNT